MPRRKAGTAIIAARLLEHQHVLILEEGLARAQDEPGRLRVADDFLRIDAFFHRRSGTSAVLGEIDDADAGRWGSATSRRCVSSATGCSISWYASTIRTASTDLGRLRIGLRAQDSRDVLQALPIDPALDRLDHLRLNVFGEDEAVRSDTIRASRIVNQPPPAPRSATTLASPIPSASMILSGRCHSSRSGPSSSPRSFGSEQSRVLRQRRCHRQHGQRGGDGEHERRFIIAWPVPLPTRPLRR